MTSKEERVTLPSHLVPIHYDLELTPNLETYDFTCNEIIHVNVTKSTNEVTLHARELYVETISFKTKDEKEVKSVEFNYNHNEHTVKIVFEEVLGEGAGQLIIHYRGILNNDMAGFYRSSYSDIHGTKKVMASTQFEALDARRAFLCWDEPAVKATFTVTLIVAAHLTALSNMPEVSVTHSTGGKSGGAAVKKIVFEKSPKMSTYLLAWAVGEFDFVQGITKHNVNIRVFSPPGRAHEGIFALDAAIRSLDFYDDYFQVPYPLPKLDMLCVTEFAMGAMENWGLVTYRETCLMIDKAKASSQSKQSVALVVAHELAHQWFGNLVTMSWWDGLWLNEGFATYMQHLCVDSLYPEYKIWEQFTSDCFEPAQRLDALKSSHPIIVPIKHAKEVEQVFDAISYYKGSTVVNMIAAILGKDKFREGLQLYMRQYAYQNTETIDLWNAWSAVSGKDMAELMRVWTTVTGYPYVTVIEEVWGENEVKITLEQSRFISDGSRSQEDDHHTWSVPLIFATKGSVSSEAVIFNNKVQTFVVPFVQDGSGQKPWIKINAGQKALVRVAHSKEMIQRLHAAIQLGHLEPVDRAALLLDSFALAKAGFSPLEDVVEILRALQNERSSIVWSAITDVLNGFHLLLEQLYGEAGAVFQRFVQFGRNLVKGGLAHVGWDAKPDESHTDKLLRASIIGLLDTFAWNDESVVSEARKRFNDHWENDAALPAEYKGPVYRIVLMNGGEAEYNRLLKSFRETEDDQKKTYVLYSLGAIRSEALKLQTLDWTVKSGEVKMQDFMDPIGSVAGSASGTELAWKYYCENFDFIKEKIANMSPSIMDYTIVNATLRFATEDRANEIEAFFKLHPLPSSERRISQCLEKIRASSKVLQAIKSSQLANEEFWLF